jgi:hypothetical protein
MKIFEGEKRGEDKTRQTFSSPRAVWQILWTDSEAMLRLLHFLSGIGALILVFGSHDCGFVSLSCKRIVVDENSIGTGVSTLSSAKEWGGMGLSGSGSRRP